MKKRTFVFMFMLLALCVPATSQDFSIDFQGPSFGVFLAGDILTVGPVVVMPEAALGVAPSPFTGSAELDAMSYGCDRMLPPGPPPRMISFSVDEFAAGIAGAPGAPNVTTEGMVGTMEASADVFFAIGLPALPPPFGVVYGNTAQFDGNGIFPSGAPGLGLVEPNPAGIGTPDVGDNLDALETSGMPPGPVYFSLDAAYADPLEPGAPGANTATAAANGVSGAAVLVAVGGGFAVYAAPAALGLVPGDDLDALSLAENGDGFYTPSAAPYDWMGGVTDMLLFSLRRGSPTLGVLDSIYGVMIEEGDILTAPVGGAVAPGILIPAEALGLATARSGFPLPSGFPDDLDALSIF